MELPEEPLPEQGTVGRVLDRVSTGRGVSKEGDGAAVKGAGGEDVRIKERVKEMRGR